LKNDVTQQDFWYDKSSTIRSYPIESDKPMPCVITGWVYRSQHIRVVVCANDTSACTRANSDAFAGDASHCAESAGHRRQQLYSD
jgi:hypothetical protein